MIPLDLLAQKLQLKSVNSRTQVFDPLRKAWVALTPEEHVRQLLVQHLIRVMHYPPGLIAVEKALSFGHTRLRFDLAVFRGPSVTPWMLIECKAPTEEITDSVLQQLLRYHGKMPQCRFWLLSNGRQNYCAEISENGSVAWLESLPAY